jgi:hypothetical protein
MAEACPVEKTIFQNWQLFLGEINLELFGSKGF